jgi:hypothetical protein
MFLIPVYGEGTLNSEMLKKGQFCPKTGHADPEREQKYSSTLSLTSAVDDGVA